MRLLLVEDERRLAEHLARGLREEGYAVDRAGTCARAVELTMENPYDLAVLDLILPDGSGLDLIPHLVGGPTPVPVIIYSVHEPESSLRDRVDAILVKSRATLDQLVAETLARIGGRRRDDR